MPGVTLRQTLFWAGNPTFFITDNSGTGSFEARALTAAESHDGLDATRYEMWVVPDAGNALEGNADTQATRSVTTAASDLILGVVDRVEIHFRYGLATAFGPGTAFGHIEVIANGGISPSISVLSPALENDHAEAFVVDPLTGVPWTSASINASTFGINYHVETSDPPFFNTIGIARIPEWYLEIWGYDPPLPRAGAHGRRDRGVSEYVSGVSATASIGVARLVTQRSASASVKGVGSSATTPGPAEVSGESVAKRLREGRE